MYAFNVFPTFSVSTARAINAVSCIPFLGRLEHWEQWELDSNRRICASARRNRCGTTGNR
jgi:hypothetical protein